VTALSAEADAPGTAAILVVAHPKEAYLLGGHSTGGASIPKSSQHRPW
jgi:hypothetical protein